MVEDGTRGDSKWADIGATAAPSIGPNTVIERDDAAERLARHEQSETDAMGLDKRREVVGGRYSPSIERQAAMYGIFVAVVAAITIGVVVLVAELDQPPAVYEDREPWAQPGAPSIEPAPIDFPRYGKSGPGAE